MIAGLVVVIIIIIAVLQQYLKGTVIHSFLALVSVILGSIITFNYHTLLSDFMISKGFGGVWAAPGSLVLIFVVATSTILAISQYFLGADIHLSATPDKIISCCLTAITATIACGVLLTAVGMTPIPGKWTYKRFDSEGFNIKDTSRTIIPADDITSGLFSMVSSGAFSSSKYFSALQPNFINQIHLNKLGSSDGVLSITGKDSLVVNKDSVWTPNSVLKDASNGNTIDNCLIVRVGIKDGLVQEGGALDKDGNLKFTLAQFRLLVGENPISLKKFDTSGVQAVYPIGYIKTKDQVEVKRNLSEVITMGRTEFKNHEGFGRVLLLDLVFPTTRNTTALAIAFRDSAIAGLEKPVSQDQIGAGINFIQFDKCSSNQAKIAESSNTTIKPIEMTANNEFLLGLRLMVDKSKFFQLPMDTTGVALQKNGEQIATANLKIYPDDKSVRNESPAYGEQNYIPSVLYVPDGFILASIKCSVSSKSTVSASDFPVLNDMSGKIYYPVGLIAGGQKQGKYVYQFDFSSNTTDVSFPKQLWLPSETDEVFEVYFVYMLPTGSNKAVIISVKQGNNQPVGFTDCEGFLAEKKSRW